MIAKTQPLTQIATKTLMSKILDPRGVIIKSQFHLRSVVKNKKIRSPN